MFVVHVIEIIIRITLQRTFVFAPNIHFAVWAQPEEVIRERLTQAKEQAAEKAEHRTIDREKVKVKDRSVQR